MEDINAQQNIREFSVQAFRKICDALVLSPPNAVKDAEDWNEKRFLLLNTLTTKVYEHAIATLPEISSSERPGQFQQTHQLIEALGKYWHVHSMNLETIIDEFVFNAIGRRP